MRERILIIEDDRKVGRALRDGLRGERYDVELADTGTDGLYRASTEHFDLILLDRGLPGMDGLDLLRTLRAHGKRMPVLVVTAKDAVEDRVAGLDAGADDYLVKPFAFPELLARVRVLLRADRHPPTPAVRLTVANLEMDLLTRKATRGGALIDLTGKEFQFLAFLVRNAEIVVSRDTIAAQIWDGFERNLWLDNAMDVHIGRIRKKVDADHVVKLIHTIAGLGFIVSEHAPENNRRESRAARTLASTE